MKVSEGDRVKIDCEIYCFTPSSATQFNRMVESNWSNVTSGQCLPMLIGCSPKLVPVNKIAASLGLTIATAPPASPDSIPDVV